MSTEIIGLPGYANVSMQKPSEMAATENFHIMPENKQDTTNSLTEGPTSLTQTVTQIKGAENSLTNLSVIDDQKVEQIKKAIREGAYQVDAEYTAGKLIALERALGK